MKKYFTILSLIFISACQEKLENIEVATYLTETEQEDFKKEIVRYYEGLPKKATHTNKFDSVFQPYYNEKVRASDVLYYYKNEDGDIYFAITKIAPSISLKKVATIGKLIKNEQDSIVYYEEICRTWKMPEEELKEITAMLFQKVIKGKDIIPYYTKNSQPKFIIEFPDDNNYYCTESRKWKTKN
ncbi:MAG: hypothetical protein ACK4UK_03590 [Flavobacterium sp.]